MNVQAVCDSNLKIFDVVARWPGSAHDSIIFENSRVCARFEAGEFGNNVLVGDGGYMNKSYLLTPLRTCTTRAHTKYNVAQIATRNVIERLFGVLKRRFPILMLGIRLNVRIVQRIVVATAVLHNICNLQRNTCLPALDEDLEMEQLEQVQAIDNEGLVGTPRQAIIEYFENI